MNKIKVSLDAEDFKTLISGGIVEDKKQGVKILLKDIGYTVLYDLLYKEMADKGYVMVEPTEHEKEFSSDSCRTHGSVECENASCKNLVLRGLNASHPMYCGVCYAALDKEEIRKQQEAEKKLTK